jgi:hypothetical protein
LSVRRNRGHDRHLVLAQECNDLVSRHVGGLARPRSLRRSRASEFHDPMPIGQRVTQEFLWATSLLPLSHKRISLLGRQLGLTKLSSCGHTNAIESG